MPTFENFQESQSTKMLYMGHTGAGKTGSICALAAAGYNVRILDLDSGVEIIKDFVTNPKSIYCNARPGLWTAEQARETVKRISYVSVTETMRIVQGKPVAKGDSWGKISKQLERWVDGPTDLGNISTWGPKDVLVIDGLSRMSEAAMYFVLGMNGRLMSMKPEQSDWGIAQGLIDMMLKLLYSDEIKCNVVMICHIAFIETESGPTRGFPQTIGKALAPKVGQYFNSALMAKSSGQGENAKRVILTNTDRMIELKNVAPLRVKPEYELATGLAEYFRDIRVGAPAEIVSKGVPAK
jgi:hypothetical protein